MLLFFLSEYKVSPCLPAEFVILCFPLNNTGSLRFTFAAGPCGFWSLERCSPKGQKHESTSWRFHGSPSTCPGSFTPGMLILTENIWKKKESEAVNLLTAPPPDSSCPQSDGHMCPCWERTSVVLSLLQRTFTLKIH